jgi:hypothetical protein
VQLRLQPLNLLGALWLQFALAVDLLKRFVKCAECGAPFEVSRGLRTAGCEILQRSLSRRPLSRPHRAGPAPALLRSLAQTDRQQAERLRQRHQRLARSKPHEAKTSAPLELTPTNIPSNAREAARPTEICA